MSFSQVMRDDFPEGMPRPGPLAALRERIRHIEQPRSHGVLPFEVAAIDRALPGGGLALGAVHEILGQGGDEEDGAAAAGFVAGILARLSPFHSPTSPRPSPPPGAEREMAAATPIPLRPSGGGGWAGPPGGGGGVGRSRGLWLGVVVPEATGSVRPGPPRARLRSGPP